MPLDSRANEPAHLDRAAPVRSTGAGDEHAHHRMLAAWLAIVAAMVVAMIALGGATRLTGSGLSIMEWRPFTGWIPPLSDREWQRLFDLYRTIPQYLEVNRGMDLAAFREIFWLEYLHRVWGRVIGVAFALPLAWFVMRGHVRGRLAWALGFVLLLGALQGAVGWFMVASGFEPSRTSVSPYRLVLHLGLAFVLLSALVWLALDLARGGPLAASGRASPSGRRLGGPTAMPIAGPNDSGTGSRSGRSLGWPLGVLLACLVLTMLAGGFVAGTRAGLSWNTFPLMDGRLVPAGYADLDPWWRNAVENLAAIQFHHRLLATATLLAAAWVALRASVATAPGARSFALQGASAIGLQYALGVATLLWVVPVGLGTLHQAWGAIALVLVLVALHHAIRTPVSRARKA